MLLYDLTACQPSRSSKRHGGGKYGEIVFFRFMEMGYPIMCYYDSTRWINPELLKQAHERGVPIFDLKNSSLKEIVKENNVNYIYSAVPIGLYRQCPCKLLFTWHGLREEETPLDNFFWRYTPDSWRTVIKFILKKYIPSIGSRINSIQKKCILAYNDCEFIMVSNHSEKSLHCYYPKFKDRDVKVFYSPSTSSDVILQKKYTGKYFLMVSGNRWEKNNLRAIIALDRLFSMGYLDGYNAKITGVKSEKSFRYKIKNLDRFDFCGYVTDMELEQLYHDAYCLIYPSLNEGFGYPPLEAMHYSVPVIASPFTSIPEICGDAALYFNPFSIEEIMSRILMISEEDTHSKYSKKGCQRYQLITEKQKKDLDSLINYLYDISK